MTKLDTSRAEGTGLARRVVHLCLGRKLGLLLGGVIVCGAIAVLFVTQSLWRAADSSGQQPSPPPRAENGPQEQRPRTESIEPVTAESAAIRPEPLALPPEPDAPPPQPTVTFQRRPTDLPEPEKALPATAEAMKQEAFEVARQVLKDFPGNSEVIGLMGTVYNRHFNTTEAVKCWRTSIRLDPRCAGAYGDLGAVAFNNGEYEEAADLWLEALRIDPSRAGAYRRYGTALLEMGKPQEAVTAFEKEKAISPRSSDNFVQLGQAYLQLRQYEKAVESYEKAVQIRPDQSSAWYALVSAHARLGQIDRAKQCEEKFKALRAAEDTTKITRRKTLGDKVWVAQLLADTHTDAARVYAGNRDRRQAERHCRRAAALDPKNKLCRQQLALLYMQSRRIPEAAEVSRQLAELDPDNALYRLKLGTVLAELRQLDAAEEAFRKGIELAPKQPVGYRLLIRLLMVHESRLSEAKTLAQKLVDLEPANQENQRIHRSLQERK